MAEVFYEHYMFTIAAARIEGLTEALGRAKREGDEDAQGELGDLCNAQIEVFLLHLRNLIDFYVSKPVKDDVVAHHYVSMWTSEMGGDSLEWLVEQLAPLLNKRLAHITAYRRRVEKTVDAQLVGDILGRLIDVHQRWRQLLSTDQRRRFTHVLDP